LSYILLQRISPNKRVSIGRLKNPTKNKKTFESREEQFIQTQTSFKQNYNGFKKVSQVSGWRLELIHHYLKELLKKNGGKSKKSKLKQISLMIEEESGIRLTLLLLSISNLNNKKKVLALLHNIQAMSIEEIYYWYAKISDPKLKNRGLKAFKLLMIE